MPTARRNRRPLPEAAAQRFEAMAEAKGNAVAGETPAPSPQPEPELEQAPSGGRYGTRGNPYRRQDGTQTRTTSVTLPVELAKRLALYCAEHGHKQSAVIEQALLRHLD